MLVIILPELEFIIKFFEIALKNMPINSSIWDDGIGFYFGWLLK